MTRWIRLVSACAAAATLASVAATLARAGTSAPAAARIEVVQTALGRILVDSKGRALYDFAADHGPTSTCYGACAALWPPFTSQGRPQAGPGVRASLLGTTRRSNGAVEVTYAGHPLYYYVADTRHGQTSGQGLDQFGAPWWVLSPSGREIHHV